MIEKRKPTKPRAAHATWLGLSLDIFDIRLLSAIQRDASLSNVVLSEEVHLSPSQCARRLERLRQEGYISGVVASLNPAKLGLNVIAHSLVSLRAHGADSNRALEQFLRESPEVLECYAQTGDADLLMKIVVEDLARLAAFLDRLVVATGGLAILRSSVVLKVLKQSSSFPLPKVR